MQWSGIGFSMKLDGRKRHFCSDIARCEFRSGTDAIRSARANLNHESVLANHGLTIQRGEGIRVTRRLLVNLS
jgi:hypothetical protein